jgi:glycosyltransferase involved in cell wall biosynthesis
VRLVFVTQRVDPDDPNLGATVAMILALAARVDEVVVLTDSAVAEALPDNCVVRPFAASSRAGRGARFTDALGRELTRRDRPAAVVAHMCPIYAVLAAPLCRPLRVRVVLWFTHWRASRLLQVAERVSTDVITVDRRSFPLDSAKVRAIGHGIDLGDFPCVERSPGEGLRVLALGRTSPAKGLETVVRGVGLVPTASLQIRGPSLTAEERDHRRVLGALVDELGVGDRVQLLDPVPRVEVPALLAGVDVLVNNMRSGATDKVVFEAAASCLPVLASNPALDTLLPGELRFERDDPDDLADRLRYLVTADRTAIGRSLRSAVEERHGVEGWADRVVAVAAGAGGAG